MEFDLMDNKRLEHDDINTVRDRIAKLFSLNKEIHVTVRVKRKNVKSAPSMILGVYKNFFTVKSKVNFYEEEFTISYIDILIGNIEIDELKVTL